MAEETKRTLTDALMRLADEGAEHLGIAVEMAEVKGYLEANRELLDPLPEETLRRLLELAKMQVVPAAGQGYLPADDINQALADNADQLAELRERRDQLRGFLEGLIRVASSAAIQAVLAALPGA